MFLVSSSLLGENLTATLSHHKNGNITVFFSKYKTRNFCLSSQAHHQKYWPGRFFLTGYENKASLNKITRVQPQVFGVNV